MKFLQNNRIKLIIFISAIFTVLFSSVSCSVPIVETGKSTLTNITDDLGNAAAISKNSRVVSCYGSFAECWILAGGMLVGVTDDAVEERQLNFDKSVITVGSVKEINMELLIAARPDYVILSADLTAHLDLQTSLESNGIQYGYFTVDTFDDYKSMMRRFCNITERDDLFTKNVTVVENKINDIKANVPKDCNKTALLMRAFSSGIKAKTDDNIAGQILKEFGIINIAEQTPSLLEDLSTEHIILTDPDYIFASTMGSEEAAKTFLAENVENNTAWAGLTAVKSGNYIMLPKNLFHYKPNNRWDKSYEYLAKILFPEIFK